MKINITHKDKSLILFFVALFVVLWAIYNLFAKVFFDVRYESSYGAKILNFSEEKWYNVAKAPSGDDLKDRVILFDFWNYSCVSCIQSFPEIKKLKERFGNKLVVISVHSSIYDNEKDDNSVKKAVLKYDITNPVVNDADLKIFNEFEVKAFPTYVIVGPNGREYKRYEGSNSFSDIKSSIKKLVKKYKFSLNREFLPMRLEKYHTIGNVLSFPSKIAYAKNFSYNSRNLPVIFISNLGQNNIIVSSLSGEIIETIGATSDYMIDGSFEQASFKFPQGLVFNNNKLYVADSGNNAIRVVDFKEKKVSTLIGDGVRGGVFSNKDNVENIRLSTPLDLELSSDKKNIIIANSGTNQILSYNLKKKDIVVLAGNGKKGIDDGNYPNNSLAQTSDLEFYKGKLYFVDSASSSLRVMDKKGKVSTLIGKKSLDFGNKNGSKKEALMQNPLALSVDETGIYILDSFNHQLKKYSFQSKKISSLVGKKKGDDVGSKSNTSFNEPSGLVSILGKFYVVDSNNNRILSVSRYNLSSKIIDIIPAFKLPKEGFLEYLPNLEKREEVSVKSESNIKINITLQKKWKINEMGPSFINLLEIVDSDEANLAASFDWHDIKSKTLSINNLEEDKDYLLQGVIYFCEDKENALCFVKSYEQRVIADDDEKNDKINIELSI